MKRTYRYDEAKDEITSSDVRCKNEENHTYMAVPCACGYKPETTQRLYTGRYA
jgi:hypothetical protein